jgi:hypothetical protein
MASWWHRRRAGRLQVPPGTANPTVDRHDRFCMRTAFKSRRFFFHKTESVRTTWKFRLLLLLVLFVSLALARDLRILAAGRTLVCNASVQPSDAILIDNFELNYLVFERAEQLKSKGIATLVFVPIAASYESGQIQPSRVFTGIAEVMAGVARACHTLN